MKGNYTNLELDISPETYFTLNEEARKQRISLDQYVNDILLDFVMTEQKNLIKELVDNVETLNQTHPQDIKKHVDAWAKVFESIDKVKEFILK